MPRNPKELGVLANHADVLAKFQPKRRDFAEELALKEMGGTYQLLVAQAMAGSREAVATLQAFVDLQQQQSKEGMYKGYLAEVSKRTSAMAARLKSGDRRSEAQDRATLQRELGSVLGVMTGLTRDSLFANSPVGQQLIQQYQNYAQDIQDALHGNQVRGGVLPAGTPSPRAPGTPRPQAGGTKVRFRPAGQPTAPPVEIDSTDTARIKMYESDKNFEKVQ